MNRRTLGRDGLEVSALGLGCMGMTFAYGETDEEESIAAIHRAAELGVTLLDTAEIYGPHTGEELVGRAIEGRRDDYEVATKFGFAVDPDAPADRSVDGRPENVRRACEGSLRRLGIDSIDLFYQHRVDPDVPIEETVGAMAELVKDGLVRHLGLSEAAPETIRRAHEVHPIAALQTGYSLWTRHVEAEVLPTVRELGIGFVAYSPLGRGFLAGRVRTFEDLDEDDWRRTNPRFQRDALSANLRLADKVRELAEERDVTPAQLALAWVMAKGDDIVPIPGTKRRERLEENVGAVNVKLSAADVKKISDAVPAGAAAGLRYPAPQMKGVNL